MALKEDICSRSSHPAFPGRKEDVVSKLILSLAIQRSFKKKNSEKALEKDVAEELADHVLNFFGYSERIIDNMLKTDDRDIFYMLEDLGILQTEREETTLYDGREWRINYWTLKKRYIANLMSGGRSDPLKDCPDDLNFEVNGVYEGLPDDMWHRE